MAIIIEDGRGTGVSAAVNVENRFLTRAVTSGALEFATLNGDSYSLDVGSLTLTTANESGILYIKNTNASFVLQMSSLIFGLGKSNTTGDTIIKLYANPTAGTLITAGTTITSLNRNYGFSAPALATTFAGAEGKTITNGALTATIIAQAQATYEFSSSIVIPNGYSFAVSITPPTSNTSMKVSLYARYFYLDPESA